MGKTQVFGLPYKIVVGTIADRSSELVCAIAASTRKLAPRMQH